MNPIKKEKKKIPLQRRISKKQKAITKGKSTLKEERVQTKLTKKQVIKKQIAEHSRFKNTFSKKKRIREKQKKLLQREKKASTSFLTIMDLWKEMEKAPWTMSMGLLKEEFERRTKKEEKLKKKLNPYVPSTKALAHHQYVLKQKELNEAKKAEWVKQQKSKKDLKHQKRAQSPNRLVCIRKEDILLRTRISDAVNLVDKEGWKFIPKQDWKIARAEGKLTLLWEVERINLEKPTRKFMKPEKVTSRYMRAERIKKGKQLDALEKEIRTRRKRKGLKPYKPIKSRTKVVVTDKYSYALIDKLEKMVYEFSKQGYKEALKKYKNHLGIIEAAKESLIGTCVISDNTEKYLKGTKNEKI